MRAVTVVPLQAKSAAISEFKEPPESAGSVLVETIAVGVCGTDIEIVRGDYGWAPPGHKLLVLGHESLGRVIDAPSNSTVSTGDLVVAIVRRPDPVPCHACAVGEWDACVNGQYTEHGIKELDGFMRERFRVEQGAIVQVDAKLGHLGVLLEPTTIVAKAWAQIDAVSTRAAWQPTTVVVTGAGPVGLLAAMIGVQRGLDVHVIDQVTTGIKPELVKALGANYHTGSITDSCASPDVIIECTGVPKLVFDAIAAVGTDGVVCLTGVSPASSLIEVDGGALARAMVLGNKVVVGSVNANRGHYELGVKALSAAEPSWLERLITRRVSLDRFEDALNHGPDDVKVVIEFAR